MVIDIIWSGYICTFLVEWQSAVCFPLCIKGSSEIYVRQKNLFILPLQFIVSSFKCLSPLVTTSLLKHIMFNK